MIPASQHCLTVWDFRHYLSSYPLTLTGPMLPNMALNCRDLRTLLSSRQVCHFDAVGTTITDHPPHRTVRARLRIQLHQTAFQSDAPRILEDTESHDFMIFPFLANLSIQRHK